MVSGTKQDLSQGEFDALVASVKEDLSRIVLRARAQIQAALLKHAPMIGRCSEFQLEILEREIGSVGIKMSWRNFLRKVRLLGRGEMTRPVVLHEGVLFDRFVALGKADRKMLNEGRIPVRIRNIDQIVKIESLSVSRLRGIITRLGILEPGKQNLVIPKRPRYFSILYGCDAEDGQIMLVCRCNSTREVKVVTTPVELQKIIDDFKQRRK
jgi:hypothetical protein